MDSPAFPGASPAAQPAVAASPSNKNPAATAHQARGRAGRPESRQLNAENPEFGRLDFSSSVRILYP
jgi:hypothetical protein